MGIHVFFGHPLTARGAPITVAIGGQRRVWHAPTGLWLATVELVPRGLRSALIRRISSHDEMSRIVISCRSLLEQKEIC